MIWTPVCLVQSSQVALVEKNLPANTGDIRDMGSVPGLGRSSGGKLGNLLQYSCLENPRDWGASVQFSSVAQSCPTLCNPMNCSTPGFPVHHQLLEFTQTHGHWVGNAIQPSHPLSSPSPPAPNPSQHHSLFQLVNSSRDVAKVLEFQCLKTLESWTGFFGGGRLKRN